MGGRGSSGATYRAKVRLTNQITALNTRIEQLRNEAESSAARSARSEVASSRYYSGSDFNELKRQSYAETLGNTEYGNLIRKRNQKQRELAALGRGQRSLF